MLSKWMVREVTVAGSVFYQAYRVTDAAKVSDQIETHGGYYTTEQEALDLAQRLNKEVKRNGKTR